MEARGRIEHPTNIDALAFNEAKKMLVISTFNSQLFISETELPEKSKPVDGPNTQYMCVSVDGKTLIIGSNDGTIEIRDFESLKRLHIIPGKETFTGMCFLRGNSQFLDIRRHALNVWEPTVLFRGDESNDTQISARESSLVPRVASGSHNVAQANTLSLTAIAEHDTLDFIFCAQEGGRVFARDTASSTKKPLFASQSTKVQVQFLSWSGRKNYLASADNASNVRLHRVEPTWLKAHHAASEHANLIWQGSEKHSIRQLLLSGPGDLLLVATTSHEKFLSLEKDQSGRVLLTHEKPSRWAAPRRGTQRFVEARSDNRAPTRAITWSDQDTQALERQSIKFDDRQCCHEGHIHLVPLEDHGWAAYDERPRSAPIVWTSNAANRPATEVTPEKLVSRFRDDANHVLYLIGYHQNNLVFVCSDYWVCSIALDAARLGDRIKYHFPVPHFWRSTNRSPLALITRKGEVVMVVGDSLAIVKNLW